MKFYVDGAYMNNGGGVGIYSPELNMRVSERCEGETGTQCEYHALIRALEIINERNFERVEVCMDNESIFKHMIGGNMIRKRKLYPLYRTAMRLTHIIRNNGCNLSFTWVRENRCEGNKTAHKLAREMIE